jgi:hypothetical protein
MYSKRASSPDVDHGAAVRVVATQAPSCAARPSAVRLTGVLLGSIGSISTTQPKRLGSLGCLRGVEALVVLVPAVAQGPCAGPSGAGGRGRVAALEVVDEVLFARQVGAPGRLAAGAVVQRAQHARPAGSAAVFISGWPAAGPPWRNGVLAVMRRAQARGAHHLPAAVGLLFDLDHRHAVRGLRLAHLSRRVQVFMPSGAAGRRRCTRGSSPAGRGLLPSSG